MGKTARQELDVEAKRTVCQNCRNIDRFGSITLEKKEEQATDRWPVPRPTEREIGSQAPKLKHEGSTEATLLQDARGEMLTMFVPSRK